MHDVVPIHKDIFAAKNVMNFIFIFRVTTQDSETTLSLPQYWKNFEKFSMNAAFLHLSSSSCSHPEHAGFLANYLPPHGIQYSLSKFPCSTLKKLVKHLVPQCFHCKRFHTTSHIGLSKAKNELTFFSMFPNFMKHSSLDNWVCTQLLKIPVAQAQPASQAGQLRWIRYNQCHCVLLSRITIYTNIFYHWTCFQFCFHLTQWDIFTQLQLNQILLAVWHQKKKKIKFLIKRNTTKLNKVTITTNRFWSHTESLLSSTGPVIVSDMFSVFFSVY